MQNFSDNTQQNQDERLNEEDDSLIMTIEYLRARLLSERSISKAAKERSDELVKRVKELEEQLKVVTSQRKKAEKAAQDVLSYLESVGISESLEDYDYDSNEEEYECESNMDKEDKSFESLENKANGKESSGSEHEPTISSLGRSLSWKGRKESIRVLEKKVFSSSMRSRNVLAQLNSVPRQRIGKSCRQIRRRELRSTDVESMHDSVKSDAQNSNIMEGQKHCQDCLDFWSEKSKRSPERRSERSSKKDEVSHSFEVEAQECDASSSTHERERSGEMERALQHQAHLIRSYEAQEKAQRDWEEKNGDNNDSCEPGSHSDVTEERDENKAVIPQPVEVDDKNKPRTETNTRGEKRPILQFNSFKISSPNVDIGSSVEQKSPEKPSTSSDFAFFVSDNNNSLETRPPQNRNGTHALVPHKEPAKLGSVLEALQEAKQVIKHHMNSSSETSSSIGKTVENSDDHINRDSNWLKLPVTCPGLFRVPTELDGQSSSQSRSLVNVWKPMDPTLDGPFVSAPVFKSEFEILNRQPRFDFYPHRSTNQMSNRFQGNEAGKPPLEYPFFKNNSMDFRPMGTDDVGLGQFYLGGSNTNVR